MSSCAYFRKFFRRLHKRATALRVRSLHGLGCRGRGLQGLGLSVSGFWDNHILLTCRVNAAWDFFSEAGAASILARRG